MSRSCRVSVRTMMLITAAVLILLPVAGMPQSLSESFLPSVLSSDTLFARADRSLSAEAWLGIAEAGIAGFSGAERESAERELERRLAGWADRRLQERMESTDLAGFLADTAKADGEFLYRIDETGVVRYDEAGDPMMKGITGIDDHTGRTYRLEDDIEIRQRRLSGTIEDLVERWERGARVVIDEIASTVSGRREAQLRSALTISLRDYRRSVERELEIIHLREQARFTALRSRDTYSLRRKSERNTAGELAAVLIEETGSELAGMRKTLLSEVRESPQEPVGEISPAGDAWEASFRDAYEQGLEKWERAERRFLEERIRWELSAQRSFTGAEQGWDEAFSAFAGARRQWAGEMTRTVEEGRAVWTEKVFDFDADFARVATELERTAAAEAEQFARDVSETLIAFRSSVETVAMAGAYLEYFREKSEETPEYEAWEAIRETALQAQEVARRHLSDLEQAAASYGTGGYDGYAVAATSREGEIERTERRVALLERQLDVSRAVLAYAEDRSSARPTEAMTVERLRTSEAVLDSSRSAYDAAREELSGITRAMADVNDRLQAGQFSLEQARAGLDDERSRFQAIWTTWTTLDADILGTVIDDLHTRIDAWFETGRTDSYRSWFEASEADARMREREEAAGVIRDLLGKEAVGQESLLIDRPVLEAEIEALDRLASGLETAVPEIFPTMLIRAGIGAESESGDPNPDHLLLLALFEAGQEATEEGRFAGAKMEGFLALLRNRAREELAENLEAEALLERDYIPGGDDRTSLAATLEKAEDELYASRAALLHAAVERTFGGPDSPEPDADLDPDADRLALLIPRLTDPNPELPAVLGSVSRLLARVASGTITRAEALEAADDTARRQMLLSLANGSDLAVVDGIDIAAGMLRERHEAVAAARARLTAFDAFGALTDRAVHAVRAERVGRVLRTLGYDPATPLPEDRFSGLIEENTAEEFISLFEQLEVSDGVPEYLLTTLQEYLSAVIRRDGMILELSGEDPEGPFIDACINLHDAIASEDDPALLASLLFRNGLAGGRESVLLIASEQTAAPGAQDPETALTTMLSDLGLPTRMLTVAEVEAFDFESYLSGLPADYEPYRDGAPARFLGSRFPTGDVFADAARESFLLKQSTGTEEPLSRILPSLLKQRAMEELSQRSARLLRRRSAKESLRTVMSIEPERADAAAEVAAFAALLARAVETFSYPPEPRTAGTAFERRNALLIRKEEIRQNTGKAAEFEVQLGNREAAEDAYYEQFVVPAQRELEHVREVHRHEQEAFDLLLGDYTAETVKYGESLPRAQVAWQRFREARTDYQEAMEIREYASGGYELVLNDPSVKYEERRAEHQRAMQILEILRSILPAEATDGFTDSLDDGYLLLRSGLQKQQEQVSLVLDAIDTFGEAASSADRRIAGIADELTDRIGRFFRLDPGAGRNPGEFRLVLEIEAGFDRFTDCRESGNDTIESYFSGEDSDEKYSRDMLLFLREIGASSDPSGMLDAFGVAYYVRNSMHLSVADDPYYQRLSADYAPFYRRVENPDYRPDQEDDGPRYLRTRNTPFIDVRIPEREWLLDRYGGTAHGVVNGSEKTRRLFAFYELMLKSGRMQPGVRDAVDYRMSRDLAEYVDDRAHDRQRSYLKWWKFWKHAEGRKIREYRRNMGGFSGISARKSEDLRSGAVTSAELSSEHGSLRRYLNDLLGGTDGKPVEFSALSSLMEKETGNALSPEFAASLSILFDGLDDAQRRSNFTALTAVRDRLEQAMNLQRQQTDERITQLRNNRTLHLSAYRAAGSAAVIDVAQMEKTAVQLFQNPAFTEEDYLAAELHFSRNTRSYHPRGEAEILETYGWRIVDLFRYRLDQANHLQYEKLSVEREELERRRRNWEDRTDELLHAGLSEWNEGLRRMIGVRQTRQNRFAREYGEKSLLWEERYERWGQSRDAWIAAGAGRAVQAGTAAMTRQMGLDANARIADVESAFIPDMSLDPPDLGQVIRQVLHGSTLDRIIQDARRLAGMAEADQVLVSASLPLIRPDTSVLRTFAHLRERVMGEVADRVALAQAWRTRDLLESTEQRIDDAIADANREFEDDLDRNLLRRGYRRSGGNYERRAVVDASLFGGPESETQRIAAYRWFTAPDFDTEVDLSRRALEGSDAEVIQAKVAKAQDNLHAFLALIFGNVPDDGTGINPDPRIGLDRQFLDAFEAAERDFASSARAADETDASSGRRFGDAKGLFTFHVGYLPVPDEDDPERMKKPGYGELGRIYERFFVHEARLSRGFALAETPWYSQKLWDDDSDNDGRSDGLFGAPSIRSVADIGLSVVAATLTAGQSLWMNAAMMTAVNLSDDLVFTAADTAGGYRDAGDAWAGFGKKAAVGMLSSGIGIGTGSLDRSIGFSDSITGAIWETGTDTILAGTRTAGNFYGSALLGSMDFSRLGTDEWLDQAEYRNMTGWKHARAGLASGMGGALVASGLDTQLRGYVNGSYTDGAALHALAGGLAGSAIEYGMSGRTMLNILNFADLFGPDASHTGLLELHIGGGGHLISAGGGGTGVSATALGQAQRGLELYRQNDRIRRAGVDPRLTSALRMAYSSEWDQTRRLYEQLLDGGAEVRFFDGAGPTAETIRESDRRIIRMQRPSGSGGDLQLGVLLAHEAFRNGIDDGLDGQQFETTRAVLGHISAARSAAAIHGNGFLDAATRSEVKLLEQVRRPEDLTALARFIGANYDSSADYWKLVMNADGTHHLEADDRKSLTIEYRNAEGNVTSSLVPAGQDTRNKGWAESFAAVVGLDRAQDLLGSKLTNSDLFDAQTLRDVLSLSDRDIARVQRAGSLSDISISDQQFLRLAGEALLKGSGASWNPQTRVWDGADGINGLQLTDRVLEGNILARVNPAGGFDYTTIHAEVFRNRKSYQGWSAHEGLRYNQAAQGLDSIQLSKRDLDGHTISSVPFRGFHTVDNMTRNRAGSDLDTEWIDSVLGEIQGNTIAEGSFGLTYYSHSGFAGYIDGHDDAVLVINNARTVAGHLIDDRGTNGSDIERWLLHSNRGKNASQDWSGGLYSNGCFVAPFETVQSMLDRMQSWGLHPGYQIRTRLEEYTYYDSWDWQRRIAK